MQHDEHFDNHLTNILEIVQGRLAELGIDGGFLNLGIIRIFNEVSMEYWGRQVEHLDIDPEQYRIIMEAKDEIGGMSVEAVREIDGHKLVLALVNVKEDAMYIDGHKVTVEDKRIVSKHRDGSLCGISCSFCEEPDLTVNELDGEFYVFCLNCGAASDTYSDKFQAIGAWLIGKVQEPDDR